MCSTDQTLSHWHSEHATWHSHIRINDHHKLSAASRAMLRRARVAWQRRPRRDVRTQRWTALKPAALASTLRPSATSLAPDAIDEAGGTHNVAATTRSGSNGARLRPHPGVAEPGRPCSVALSRRGGCVQLQPTARGATKWRGVPSHAVHFGGSARGCTSQPVGPLLRRRLQRAFARRRHCSAAPSGPLFRSGVSSGASVPSSRARATIGPVRRPPGK